MLFPHRIEAESEDLVPDGKVTDAAANGDDLAAVVTPDTFGRILAMRVDQLDIDRVERCSSYLDVNLGRRRGGQSDLDLLHRGRERRDGVLPGFDRGHGGVVEQLLSAGMVSEAEHGLL